MARIGGAIICLLIVLMDISAGILGIQAEIAQNKEKHLKVFIFECKEPSHQAYKLGLSAAVLLALAHAIANLLGGCTCRRTTTKKQLAAATLAISWIILVVGFTMLIIGAMSNSKSRVSCGFAHHKFLSNGGIVCFIHGLFCVSYYVFATAARSEDKKSTQMGTTA